MRFEGLTDSHRAGGWSHPASASLPLRHDAAVRLHLASRYVSYYWALEIMLMAVPLTSIAMGPMTANLLSDLNFPPCIELNKHYPNPPGEPKDLCFAVDVQPDLGYNLTCVTVVLYLLAGFDGSPAHKYIHRLLYPDDAAPPPTWTAYYRWISCK